MHNSDKFQIPSEYPESEKSEGTRPSPDTLRFAGFASLGVTAQAAETTFTTGTTRTWDVEASGDLRDGESRDVRDVQIGAAPGERTPASLLRSVADDPWLTEIDNELAGRGEKPPKDDRSARVFFSRWERIRLELSTREILDRYGISSDTITFMAQRRGTEPPGIEFPYKGNLAHINIKDVVTEVRAWDARLSAEERDQACMSYDAFAKQGARLANIRRIYQSGTRMPKHLSVLNKQIKAEYGDIETAYNEHVQQMHAHSLGHGFRLFRINSAAGMRLVIPIALHLLEQSPEDTSPLVLGNNGEITVIKPGVFSHTSQRDITWAVTEEGRIEQVKKS